MAAEEGTHQHRMLDWVCKYCISIMIWCLIMMTRLFKTGCSSADYITIRKSGWIDGLIAKRRSLTNKNHMKAAR